MINNIERLSEDNLISSTQNACQYNLENKTTIEDKGWNICHLAYQGCLKSQDKSRFFEKCSLNYDKCETYTASI